MNRSSLRVLSALSLVFAFGCNKLVSLAEKAGAAPSASAAAADGAEADPAVAADEKLGEKLETYLTGCLNNSARTSFRNSADNYFENVDEKKGPAERHVPYLYKVEAQNIAECEQAVTKAKGMAPALPELENAAQAYLEVIKTGAPSVNEAQAYYDQKDYKDDKFAKGQAWHPKLVELFKKFESSSRAISDAFGKQKGPLDTRDLERLKVKGPKVAYLTKRTVMDADVFDDAIEVKTVKDFYALPVADLQAKVDILTQGHAELQKLVEAKGKELEGTSGVDRYTSELEDFVKEAKAVTRRIRDQTKFTNSELERLGTGAGWMTEGSPDKLDREHGSLISAYNSMRL